MQEILLPGWSPGVSLTGDVTSALGVCFAGTCVA